MAGNMRRRKVRSESMGLDVLHIIIGVAVVIMAAFSFINPERYMFLFPAIFLLAAALNLISGRVKERRAKDRGQRAAAMMQMIFGLAFLILAVISAVSVWWR